MCVRLCMCGGRKSVVGGKQLPANRPPKKSTGAENASPLADF